MKTQYKPVAILRRKEVESRTGLSRTGIYARINKSGRRCDYDPIFPRLVRIGLKAVGWFEAEIEAWIAAQIQKRAAE